MATADIAPAGADTADGHGAPTVTLRQAATLLGTTEAAVLMRVFRGSLPSHLDHDGGRRVPLTALHATLRGETQPPAAPDLAALTATLETVAEELGTLRARIEALESRPHAAPPPLPALLEALARDLRNALARMTARRARQPWAGRRPPRR